MLLHVPTLIFINGLLGIVAAIMLTANWQMNKHVRGTKEWAITQWLWAFGLLLILTRDIFPYLISIVLSNALIIIGSFYFLRGVSNYQGVKSTPKLLEYSVTLVIALLFYYFSYHEYSLNIRVVLISAFSSLVMLRGLIVLWPTIISSKGVGIVVGFGLAFHAVFFLSRILLTLYLDNGKPMLEGGGGSVWIMTEASLFMFWSTISFAMLTNLVLQNGLLKLANRDPLTNLLNRRAVFEACQDLLQNQSNPKVSVMVLDLDHFKAINDQYGHSVGDKVLQHFAHLVSKELDDPQLFGRTGGEEFIIVLPNCDVEKAHNKAQFLLDKVHDTLIIVDGYEIKFTVSIGVSNGALNQVEDLRFLINQADKAMYQAKRNGRNRVETFTFERQVRSVTV
ncbi:MAG: GGDEF domain-containing protein [Kangiellaceae bacterium]|nr:GGDEF domain-containing protein [Kangiellaceae bacterium]